MQRLLFFLCLVHGFVFSSHGDLIAGSSDPAMNHHVNVISGRIQLTFEDHLVQGAVPLSLNRTYTNHHVVISKSPKWGIKGGWSLFSHTHIYVMRIKSCYHAWIVESSGRRVAYITERIDADNVFMKPNGYDKQNAHIRSSRNDLNKNRLTFDRNNKTATLHLADGGKRIYKLSVGRYFLEKTAGTFRGIGHEYTLSEEVFSSGQKTKYVHTHKKLSVQKVSPSGNKVFSSINLKRIKAPPYLRIEAKSSDNKKIYYRAKKLGGCSYLETVFSVGMQNEVFSYKKDSTDLNHWLKTIDSPDYGEIKITYNLQDYTFYDPVGRSSLRRRKPIHQPIKDFKVKTIHKKGVLIASFNYKKNLTEVRDVNNSLTKYHYYNGGLEKIERFTKDGVLYSTESFIWKDKNLAGKEFIDGNSNILYTQAFSYDAHKNITKETFTSEGKSHSKWYTYNDKHLLIKQEEEGGLTYLFEYLSGTDLLTSKKTVDDGEILSEESYAYDNDLLLIEKRCFDGYRESYERYVRDPQTGMIVEMDNGLVKTFYTYDKSNKLIAQETEFGRLGIEYTLSGKVKSKTFPLGGQNQYSYNKRGNPIAIKEVGAPCKYISYDEFNRPASCTVGDRKNKTIYDKKGRVILEKDFKGRVTSYVYDEFDRCIKKTLPHVQDENGEDYHPEFHYKYNVLGNLISEILPSGAVTKTTYNIFKKPLTIYYADGSIASNTYYENGDLKESVFQNGEKTSFVYDPLHRLIEKRQGPFEEHWEYEGRVLKKYTNPRGLFTTYESDEFGRKISEDVEGRKKEFFYDEMGFLERVEGGGISSVTVHDIEGRVIETSQNGFNRIRYEYNDEGKKSRAIKTTSEGEAVDQFFYDDKGRLVLHLDPLEGKTEFIYEDYVHTQIDPLGNRSVETFDALSRLILKEKQSPSGETLLSERFFFDRAGNVSKRYTKDPNLEVEFHYDIMGRLVEEIEAGKKRTLSEYDDKGRLLTKTDPKGISFDYTYDDLDRLGEMKSSDNSVYHVHTYSGLDLVEITDLITGKSITRSFTKFGELSEETGFSGFKTSWFYDTFGRKKETRLPDGSAICYCYGNGCMTSVSRYDRSGNFLYEHQYTAFDANQHVAEESLPMRAGLQKSARDIMERPLEVTSPFHKLEVKYNSNSLVTKKTNTLTGNKDYSYDALSQLTGEGEDTYAFDPLGNPKDAEINDLNQIVSTETDHFTYDANGNLLTRNDSSYSYDALNRLTTITYTTGKTITFSYDPLSRLVSKNESGTTTYFLYDGAFEIGTIDGSGCIEELKVLGLGTLGDIGAAIAIEINDAVYIPLHDLGGNIIGIADSSGVVVERYPCNAFGEEQDATDFINPWRFSSKRTSGGLIFFGRRVYDPGLKRWLTPDPLGFVDSRNPYLYVLNSPLNRLDVFGLTSRCFNIGLAPQYRKHQNFTPYRRPHVNHHMWIAGTHAMVTPFFGRAQIDGRDMPVGMRPPKNYMFKYSPQELKQGYFNAYSRIKEWITGSNGKVGMFSVQNGIMNSPQDFRESVTSVSNKCPDNALVMGVYNKSNGLISDVWNTFLEKWGVETVASKNLKAHFTMLLDEREAHAPESFIEHIAHSRAGATYTCMFKNMPDEYQKNIQDFVYADGIGPASLIPKDYGKDAQNYYSTADFVTGWFALNHDKEYYDVTWVTATTPKSERMGGFADHGLLGATYQGVTKNIISECQKKRGGIHVYQTRR
jgi:RHS repeat-associated protein